MLMVIQMFPSGAIPHRSERYPEWGPSAVTREAKNCLGGSASFKVGCDAGASLSITFVSLAGVLAAPDFDWTGKWPSRTTVRGLGFFRFTVCDSAISGSTGDAVFSPFAAAESVFNFAPAYSG